MTRISKIGARKKATTKRKFKKRRLKLEPLEMRRVLTTYVFSTSDSPFDAGVDNQGWWSDSRSNNDSNDNYFTGFLASTPNTSRSFFTFDLANLDLSSESVVSATLRLTRFGARSPDNIETLELFDVSTPAAVLNDNSGVNLSIYNDLGTGTSYGAFDVNVGGPSSVLEFDLNSDAFADIAAAEGDFFSVGGSLASLGQTVRDEFLFGFSNDSGTQELVVETAVTNQAPVASDDAFSVDEDSTLTVGAPGVLGNDTDADGDSLTASLVTDVSSGSLSLSPDGSFTYTPNPDFNGTDSFTYVANDGTADSNVATVTIEVNSVIDALIDVKPGNGDEVDPINLGSNGKTPIAILATQVASGEADDFEPSSVDLALISFAINGESITPDKITLEDVDGDGDEDLLLHFLTADLADILADDATELTLSAEFGGAAQGADLQGTDAIKIVPSKGKGKNK